MTALRFRQKQRKIKPEKRDKQAKKQEKSRNLKDCGIWYFLMEMRGVEPLSESTLTETSPGAGGYLDSLGEA